MPAAFVSFKSALVNCRESGLVNPEYMCYTYCETLWLGGIK